MASTTSAYLTSIAGWANLLGRAAGQLAMNDGERRVAERLKFRSALLGPWVEILLRDETPRGEFVVVGQLDDILGFAPQEECHRAVRKELRHILVARSPFPVGDNASRFGNWDADGCPV